MAYRFRENIHPIAIILFVFFYGCHSLPPSGPLQSEEKGFNPSNLLWEKVSMPGELIGDWYREGMIYLTVVEDTLRVQGVWTLIKSAAKSDSYYRIIYKIGEQYHTLYFCDLTKEEVKMVYASGTAEDEERASALPVVSSWSTLTSTNPWVPKSMPGLMPGNWHISDSKMEMSISQESVVFDEKVWEIDSVQTNRHVDRLVLKSGNEYKTVYFEETGEYEMKVFLVDGKEDIQDRFGKVHGDWIMIYRWWDFLEKINFSQGSSWNYDYIYRKYYDQVYDTSSPIDSIMQINFHKGWLYLQVTSNTISSGGGSIVLQATFHIDEEKGRYYKAQKNGGTQVLTDSSWTGPGGVITEQYEIVLENDTLWYRTEEGNIFFASMKLGTGSQVNLLAFVKPFEFPKEGFPDGKRIIGPFKFPHEYPPQSTWASSNSKAITIAGIRTNLLGQITNNYAYITFGYGIKSVNCFFGDYDQRIRYGYGQYYNPYLKETSFSCKVLQFSPGY